MLYNIHDGKFSRIFKMAIFWLSFLAMIGLFIFLLKDEIKLPQRQITLDINIKNKVNICASKESEKNLAPKKIYEF